MNLTLIRVSRHEDGTFGVLLHQNDAPFALTLEREWLDNRSEVSCIPEGTYICRRVMSPKFGETFEVTGVPGRSHILFHTGNVEDDSKGCILVGEQFENFNGKVAILSSKKGFGELMEKFKGIDEFTLSIKWAR